MRGAAPAGHGAMHRAVVSFGIGRLAGKEKCSDWPRQSRGASANHQNVHRRSPHEAVWRKGSGRPKQLPAILVAQTRQNITAIMLNERELVRSR